MDDTAGRRTLIRTLMQQLQTGPVTVRAEDIDISPLEWRSAAREAAQRLDRPLTVYAHGTVTWVRLAEPPTAPTRAQRLPTFG
ncbi:hypothetical protein [Leifsonia xyli]|nr:hypothetical protein [Leifsonia xyli]